MAKFRDSLSEYLIYLLLQIGHNGRHDRRPIRKHPLEQGRCRHAGRCSKRPSHACHEGGRGSDPLFGEEFRRGDAGLLYFAADRASQAVLGHPHRLHRLADFGRSVAQPWRLPLRRYAHRRHSDGRDRPEFRERPDRVQHGPCRLDWPVPVFLAARSHATRLRLRSRRLHREPDWVPECARSRFGFRDGIRACPGNLDRDSLSGPDPSLHTAEAHDRPVHRQAVGYAAGCPSAGGQCAEWNAGRKPPRPPPARSGPACHPGAYDASAL